jgi:YhcH/YjgK/YiaL family protein
MIIDQLSQLQKYIHLHLGFKKAVDFIESNNLDTLNPGEISIDESLRIIVIHDKLVSKEISIAAFECHNRNIDIQIILEGSETIGWKPRNTCISAKGEYSAEKDVLFFNDKPDMYFQLQKGQFGIYFPNDVHAPMIGEGSIKKIVMKVLV